MLRGGDHHPQLYGNNSSSSSSTSSSYHHHQSSRTASRSSKSAQTRVVECLNYWMSLPETSSLVQNLVDESLSKANLLKKESASPPSHSSPSKQNPRTSLGNNNNSNSPTAQSPTAVAGGTHNSSGEAASLGNSITSLSSSVGGGGADDRSSANSTPHSALQLDPTSVTTPTSSSSSSSGGGLSGKKSPRSGSGGLATTPHHAHQAPSVQHCVDELDFAHRRGGISPRTSGSSGGGGGLISSGSGGKLDELAASAGDPLNSSTGSISSVGGGITVTTTTPAGGMNSSSSSSSTSSSSSSSSSPSVSTSSISKLAAVAPTKSPFSDSLPAPPNAREESMGARAKSPDAFLLNEPKASPEPHHFEPSSSSSPPEGGGKHHARSDSVGSTMSEQTKREKSDQTARIENAVKHQDDPVPRATIGDIPRFYVPPVKKSQLSSTNNSTSSTTSSAASSQREAAAAAAAHFPLQSAAVQGTTTGLTEQQEVAIFTRIINALANAGAARKVPPKSAGPKSRGAPTPQQQQHSNMTPLNAIVQITTESFGLPGVFAKIIHAKLVYGGKGNAQIPLTLQSVKTFYDSYIQGNSIEKRMFEVLLGASEVNFPIPAATTLYGVAPNNNPPSSSSSTTQKRAQSALTGGSRSAATASQQQQQQKQDHNSSHHHPGGVQSLPGESGVARGSDRQYLVRADFAPLIQILLDHHPGLAFLKQTADFQSRYLETVVIRIFFELDKNDTGRITWEEFRRSLLPVAIRKADSNEDINLVLDFFSYEHFYVLYCRFWELDTDKDFLISKDDLVRYYPDNSTNPIIVDRIVAGVGRPLRSHSKGKMNFEDFVWFCLCEEHKAHPRAIAYWFRILDVDQDGIISGYELETFYNHTKEKMRILTAESIVFDDVMCQVSDMMSFSRRSQPPPSAAATAAAANNNNNTSSNSAAAGNQSNASSNSNSNSSSSSSSTSSSSTTAARPGTAGARPRSAAPVGSAARLMTAAPSARPVVGTNPLEERRLSLNQADFSAFSSPTTAGNPSSSFASGSSAASPVTAGNQNSSFSSSSSAAAGSGSGGGDGSASFNQGSSASSSSSSLAFTSSSANTSEGLARQLRLHAGFTLSDFLRCPTAAHVAINMLTNVSKFLQFEQRDPFVASHERPNREQQQQQQQNHLLDGMGLLGTNNLANSGPLEKTEWDRFCRQEYDRMSSDEEN